MTAAVLPPVCDQFIAETGGAHPWCQTCGWQQPQHIAPTVRFGDVVTLRDGREGTVTFVDGNHVRFVLAGQPTQQWTWEHLDSIDVASDGERTGSADA